MTMRSFAYRVLASGLLAALIAASATAAPTFRINDQVKGVVAQLPTPAQCEAEYGIGCFGPQQIRTAYGLHRLIDAGYDGAGQTIVLIESYGSPTLEADLQQFDAEFGLPPPPSLKVIAPIGAIPPFDPTNNDVVGWAEETSLDVQWSHALAPHANIVVLVSPVDETEGVQGLPQFLALEQYALDHDLGKIISQSWGATENTLFTAGGEAVFANFNAFYARAAAANITVFASTGDNGSTDYELDGVTLYPFPVVDFPSTSPYVTAVGGTALYLTAGGQYWYETVWNDNALGYGAGSGGISQAFSIPWYQQFSLPEPVRHELGGHRGVPDVSFNADDYNSGVWVYLGFLGPSGNGFYLFGGTSEGSPAWAGITADLNEYAGFPLGFLNPTLYTLGAFGQIYDFAHDVTFGNNSYAGVPGYDATPGWDLATGWGTPKLELLPERWAEFLGAHY
jgi:subtilase family serine protease